MSRNRFIIVVAVLIIIAILILLQIQLKEQKPPVKAVVENETEQMKTAVMGLYNSYKECMTNPPVEAFGQVSTYCQDNNQYAAKSFVSNLEKGGVAKAGADPITCAQNIAQNIQVGRINPAQQTVEVLENFGGTTDVKIKISLIEENNSWKINNVICPLP